MYLLSFSIYLFEERKKKFGYPNSPKMDTNNNNNDDDGDEKPEKLKPK